MTVTAVAAIVAVGSMAVKVYVRFLFTVSFAPPWARR